MLRNLLSVFQDALTDQHSHRVIVPILPQLSHIGFLCIHTKLNVYRSPNSDIDNEGSSEEPPEY